MPRLLDEASSFISPDIETILTQARKFGLHLILANQMVKQGGMKPELHEAIMGNTALKIIRNAGHTTKTLMSAEMELTTDDVRNLPIGGFVLKADGKKAHRIRLPKFWLGKKQLCTAKQWEQAKACWLDRYYPKPSSATSQPSRTKPTRKTHTTPKRPKFGIANPFGAFCFFTPQFV